jgi:hypothetical protein
MKKFILILICILFVTQNTYAKIIYCFKANKGNELIKTTIPTDLINSDEIRYFLIDDKKKKFIQIKSFYEGSGDIKYSWEDNNTYRFYYDNLIEGDEKFELWNKAKFIKFNKNEIIISIDFETKSQKKRRYKLELDRIAGILLIANIELNELGEEIVTDEQGTIYTKDEDKFRLYIKDKKYFCEEHKNL